MFGADCSPDRRRSSSSRADADLLIVEATLPRPERTGERGHLTPQEAGEHATRRGRQAAGAHPRLGRARRALGPQGGAQRCFDGPIEVAREGAVYTLSAPSRAGRRRHHPCLVDVPRRGPLRELRAHAARDRRAVRRRVRAQPGSRRARGFSPAGRRLLLRTTRRARWSRPTSPGVDIEDVRARDPRAASSLISRRAHGPRGRGPALPADRDRARARSGAWSSSAPTSTPSEARATYEDGILRDRDPARAPGASRPAGPDRGAGGPETAGRASVIEVDQATSRGGRRAGRAPALPDGAAGAAAEGHASPFPNTLTPLAVGQERSVQLVNDVLGGNRMLVMVAVARTRRSRSPARTTSTASASPGVVARMLKVPDGTLRILVQGGQRVRIDEFVATEPVPGRPRSTRRPTSSSPRPSSRRSRATSRPPSRRSSRRCRTCPRSCRSRSRTSTTPRSSAT